jgi:signal transduction histidine kinase
VNSRIRRQARFYIFAFMIPIFGAAITDYGLPAMHIYTLPPMGLTTLSLMTVVLLIGIIRFNAFRLSPSILAQNILDTMRESVVVTNSQLEIEFMNAEAEKLFNLELEKAGKSDFSRYLSGSDKHSLLNQLQHLENKPHSDAIEAIDNLTLANTGHAQVNLRILASGVLNRGKLEGYLFAISDVTELTQTNNALAQALAESKELESQVEREKASVERKVELRTIQLRDERARLEASIDSLDAGFLMTDDKNNIITINGAAQRIIFHPDTINSETPTALTWQGPATTLNKIAEAFASSFNLVHLIEKCLKDQQPSELKSIDYQDRILDIFIAPIMQIEEHEAALGAVVLIEDITEEKIQERSKEEFFTITSHELRTPLTAIRGSVSIIQQYYGKQFSDPEAMKMLDIIYNSSVRLISIVNDFLEVSQLEQGRIELGLTPFAIEPMVETAKIELSSLNSGKNLAINIDKSLAKAPEIYASSDHIKQVLSHLIGNAISYTDSGSVTVSAEVQSKFLKVFVADTGVGISRENQKLLFRKLQQAGDNLLTHGPTKGTGLGLYISKLLIERMGGTIALESSEPSKGTTFSFTIPLATKKQITDAAKAKPVEIADEELRLPR